MDIVVSLTPLFAGWLADNLFGDPVALPHPIVWFGRVIAWGDKKFNKGKMRELKGALFAITLISLVYVATSFIMRKLYYTHPALSVAFSSIIVFYCLAGKTLIKEVKAVFKAVDESIEKGRKQVSRIVGRDTSALSEQEIKKAALETLSENLSDGVIAPLFWFLLLGAPGMLSYKMINTLDSMIGYKSPKHLQFGKWAALIDDVANYIPARLTGFLMLATTGKLSLLPFLIKYGKMHASPNAGYPESALAGILDCQFGGGNTYYGQRVEKPFIGTNPRGINFSDMQQAIAINKRVEVSMILLIALTIVIFSIS